jgi:signal peptidase II
MHLKRIIIICICIFWFVGCDQSSKQIAKHHLENSSAVSYMGGFIRLIYAENPGGILGIGSDFSPALKLALLIAGISIVLFLFIYFLIIKREKIILTEISLVILLSGAIGNILDRIFNEGKVIDFIIISTGNIHTAVFNLADVFIMTGTLLFILSSVVTKKEFT